MRIVRFGTALAVLAAVLFTGTAQAQVDVAWVTAGNGSYQTALNWDDGTGPGVYGIPQFFDNANHFLIDTTAYTVSSTGIIDIGSVIVAGNATTSTADDVTYDLGGGTMFANGGPTQANVGLGVIPGVGNGRLTVLNGIYDVGTAFTVTADPLGPASAVMNIGAGATVRTGTLVAAADVVGAGGGAIGTLNVSSAALYDGLQPQAGNDAGDLGIINVSGAGTILDNVNPGAGADMAHAMAIGLEGTGELNITAGGLVRTQSLGAAGGFTGLTGIGSATINVDNASLIHEGAFDSTGAGTIVSMGDGGGTATMNLTNNAVFTTDFLVIAGGTIAGNSATFNVESGSDWTSSQWRMGENLGNSATLNLDGAGTTMTVDFRSFVGLEGSGEFNVTNGAVARFVHDPANGGTGVFVVGGVGVGSAGDVVIDGPGSTISSEGASSAANLNSILIGRQGTGNVTVSNGGLLTTGAVAGTFGNICLGFGAGTTGVLNVDGAGSIARSHTNFNVGGTNTASAGAGTVNLTNGGSIETTNLVIYAGDTVSLSGGGYGTIGTIGTTVNTANTLTVRTGGILRGVGTVNGNVAVVTGGTVAPGLSPGLLTVNGDLNLGNCVTGAGGTYNMEITTNGVAGTNYDSMTVSGSALLGGTLNLIVAGTYVPNGAHQFNVVTGSSNVVGAVQSITNRVINPAGVGGTVWGDYNENNPGVGTDRYYIAPRRNGDFNGIGGVTGADFTIWADNFGQTWQTFGEGDANGDRLVTGADFTIWADNFGQTSLDTDGAAVSTYGYGVDMAAFDVEVSDYDPTADANLEFELKAIRTMNRLDGAGIPDVAGGSIASVPEPSSLVLGALALVGMAAYGLRRRSA